MKRSLPLLLLLLVIPALSHAQDDKDWWKMSDSKKPTAPSTPVTPPAGHDLNDKIKTFRNSGRFSVKYNKFEDYTSVRVGPFYIGAVARGVHLEMSAVFIKDENPVDKLHLIFRVTSKDWTFLRNRDLFALVDGERLSFGEGDRDSDIRSGSLSERLIFSIPAESFAKLGTSQTAELKVGRVEFILKDEHKEAFRDLLSLLK